MEIFSLEEQEAEENFNFALISLLKIYTRAIFCHTADTVTPKTLSILTSMVVRAAHHQTPWESHLALVELKVEYTLGYKIAPLVM